MIFFNNRDHALYTDSVSGTMRHRNVIFKYRFFAVTVCHIDTELMVFLIDLQANVTGIRIRNIFAGVDGIFQRIRQKLSLIHI